MYLLTYSYTNWIFARILYLEFDQAWTCLKGCVTVESSGKGILVIDIDDAIQSNHDDFIKICGKCEKVATHFCQTCNENLCKFCIIDHYKNTEFTKIWNDTNLVDLPLIFP